MPDTQTPVPLEAYTSFDSVRAALGVSDDELTDQTLTLDLYFDGLLEDLAGISVNLQGIYETLPDDDDRTPLEARVYRLTRSFATYSVAKQLTPSLPMFAPRSLGDGKATMSRFLDPYKDTVNGIVEQFNLARERLIQALADLLAENTEDTFRPLLVAVGLGRDPVTAEE